MPLKATKSSLSVIIQTKNEEQNILDCINSCKSIANEVLVVDMESTDNTQSLAKKAGAKVITIPDQQFVEPSRQVAINLAKSEWILLLDADERITPSLKVFIKKHIDTSKHSVVRFPRKNIMFNKWMKYGLQWPDYQVRLFKKGKVTWPAVIHSQPIWEGEGFMLPATEKNAILHYNSTSLAQRIHKTETQAFNESYYSSHPELTAKEVFDRITGEFGKRFFIEEGYKDGLHGFIFAKMMGYYRFLEFAKYWEDSGYEDFFSSEELKEVWDLNKQLEQMRIENEQIHNSKFYKFYTFAKKMISKVGMQKGELS